MAPRWTIRVGRRGALILLMSVLTMYVGAGLFAAPPTTTEILDLINLLPTQFWGLIWAGTGLVSIPFAFKATGEDRLAFGFLGGPPFLWGTAYAVTAVSGHYPLGVVVGLRGAFIYFVYTGILLITSGMIGLRDTRRRR